MTGWHSWVAVCLLSDLVVRHECGTKHSLMMVNCKGNLSVVKLAKRIFNRVKSSGKYMFILGETTGSHGDKYEDDYSGTMRHVVW
jgi:hypothetical protein